MYKTGAVFVHGLSLDLSMAGYLTVIPFILVFIQQTIPFSFYKSFFFLYSVVLIIVNSFIFAFDAGIYREWNTHLNFRAISYLRFTKEASAFTDWHELILLALVMIIQIITGTSILIMFFKKNQFRFPWNRRSILPGILFHAFLFPLLFVAIRGGVQLIPINESSAYFSTEKILNDAALNILWNASKRLSQDKKILHSNPYQYLSHVESSQLLKQLYTPSKDSLIQVLKSDRPNIILFILESFTADIFEALNGEKGITPNLDSVISQGLLFTNIYSQGYRTDQGLTAIFSGFPATPDVSVMMQPEKYGGLGYLPGILASIGYSNSFYYGGELNFANMKAYLFESGIVKLIDKSSYATGEMSAKWGAHDEFVFKKQGIEIDSEIQPHFSAILSLSSHEPFDVPGKPRFPGDDVYSKFKSSCFYTDHCIGEYLKSVKNKPWFKNTLFVFVADHGHILPRNRSPDEPARFHIPVIFYGTALKPEFRGATINNTGMQCDLTATLLSQLKVNYTQFHWSNNLLNYYRNNFAYYSFDAGIGFINDSSAIQFNFHDRGILAYGEHEKEQLNAAKAFLQILYGEYLSF